MSEMQSRFDWPSSTPKGFQEFHELNPHVFEKLAQYALEARRAGRARLSINMLFERLRWYTAVETQGDSFKLNNTWRAFYARLLMERVPELTGLFETRKSKADSSGKAA